MKYDNIDLAIVNVYLSKQAYFKKKYSYLSQESILATLKSYHNIDICLRTLAYRLRKLEDLKIIHRIQRHCRGQNGMMLFKSSAVYMGPKLRILIKIVERMAWKTLSFCGLQPVADYYKESKDLLFKTGHKCGQIVDRWWITNA